MASPTQPSIELNSSSANHEEEEVSEVNNGLDKYYDTIATLPSHKGWDGFDYFNHGKFWCPSRTLAALMAIRDTFKPFPSDIFVTSYPKSGTTWIKALVFAIVNRARFAFDASHPLLLFSPHVCVPFLEVNYAENDGKFLDSNELSSPRILGTHIPYSALPLSLMSSKNRIIYLCRDPKDTFISAWHFINKMIDSSKIASFNETFELFCEGYSLHGPIWEHILEYWTESLRQPNKILFLKYEDLKVDIVNNIKKLAEFIEFPFSEEEVRQGIVEQIAKLCSFDKLSKIEANNTSATVGPLSIRYSNFFREGKVGGWQEHLSSEMAQKLDNIIEEKLQGSGLTLGY